jgi:hypothetical protein
MEVPEGWAEIEGALQREFRFKDFSATPRTLRLFSANHPFSVDRRKGP